MDIKRNSFVDKGEMDTNFNTIQPKLNNSPKAGGLSPSISKEMNRDLGMENP